MPRKKKIENPNEEFERLTPPAPPAVQALRAKVRQTLRYQDIACRDADNGANVYVETFVDFLKAAKLCRPSQGVVISDREKVWFEVNQGSTKVKVYIGGDPARLIADHADIEKNGLYALSIASPKIATILKEFTADVPDVQFEG